ncbi:HhH-GPD superfamily base excision DNA repair protein [Desulfitobacterium dichloroeliminans LMG P-21439]|uniref:DNA-3-methyladenine glycosylase II n=1 Tax=Desulfitobacterium dichloroeliminans (strain LMG P-21439 / DCA1) TaxID=871963 RepID=L0FAJ7_DESDL|nr:DNA-3-methyladenine glycosylase [Desulfitobacterium dichloroeliminans]AGA69681.1 HhH-GPD superfamily base excision DNA repair protein [Desulfitobacterium dichloroeliminans LMG P-21439]
MIFPYGLKEIEHLKAQDPVLGQAIDQIGMIEREVTPQLFEALISSVVSQQISKKAAETVWNRLQTLLGEVNAEQIDQTELEAIQGCGMSMRKAGYIKGIAEAAQRGEVDFEKLPTLSDDEIIKLLPALPGVGVWTAEMLLIFSLCRPDVVSFKDLAIRRGMMNCYGLNELTKETFDHYRQKYSPYGSVASLYLWALS